jgi:Kef-type K+ transport system membrane component KefB
MLLLAKLLGEALAYFKQPAIIGEILAGILLGPTVLGMISPSAYNYLFPSDNEIKVALDGITNLAVIMLLLVSGLELDFSIVLTHGKVASTTSILGIIVPFILGFGISYFFPGLMGLSAGENRTVFALFIGTAIAISSLPVIAKILMDLKIFKTEVGLIIISAAMLNDLIGWFIFSIILSLLGINTHGFSFSETIIYTLLFLVFILFIGRKIINKFIPWIQDKFSFPGSILNFILILGFLGAAFTEFIGVHAILGAFIVGIAIGDSPHLKESTREIVLQFITNIFAPLFFVSIGLRVNFVTNFNVGIILILLVLALAGKVTGASLGARIGGLKKNESLAVGFGMSSSGAMGIIIGLLALQFGLIKNEVFVGLVFLALFTSILSAPVMKFLLREKIKLSFKNLILPELVLFNRREGKNELIKNLIDELSKTNKIDKEDIFKKILMREESNPTGISNYLAIPHTKAKIKKPLAAAARHVEGLDFDAVDSRPSKIIILLLVPENENELQLQLLSEIASKFSDITKVEELLSVQDKESFVDKLKSM